MHRRANMIFRRSDHSVVYNKGYIYAVGAFVEGKFTNSMERYTVSDDDWHKHTNRNNLTSEAQAEETKISEDIWEQKDSMSTPRSGVGLCVFNHNYIYAFGGRNNNNYHMTLIERYDIRSDFWEVINNAKTELWGEGAYL